ncbi:MAG TPA: hypothetical protein VM142_05445 [Acidimicrobiales bacterium]|nr:hypothetical protein [Acidimicrobiales bacterium]
MAVAGVAVLAACSGGSDDTAQTTRPDRSSTTTTPAASSSSTTSVPTGGAAAPEATSTTTAARAGAPSQRGATKPTTSPPDGIATATTTPPGRYRYASTGTFSAGVTGEQRRSGESILTVDPPAGADQHSLRQGDNRSSEQILRFQPDGTYIVMLKITDQGLTKEFRPATPVLAFPYSAPVGRTWSWRMTSTDGKTTVETSFRIERTEAVPVGSQSVPAVVVQATVVTTGDLTSRGTQTLWVAESRRLVVREQSATEGTFGAFSFRSTAEERLLQLDPS